MERFNFVIAILGFCGLISCKFKEPVIGFIPAEPVSISSHHFGSFQLNVAQVEDTIELSAPSHASYTISEVRQSTEHALTRAFSATFSDRATDGEGKVYELRMLRLTANYRPLGYYTHTIYSEPAFDFGPQRTSATKTTNNPYSIDVEYRAVLYQDGDLVATFNRVVDSPGVWDMRTNLKKAMERMAEHVNSDVVEFLLKRTAE